MSSAFGTRALALRNWVAASWWAILLVALGFWVAFQYVEPAPSKVLVFSSGVEGGAYHRFAESYADVLAKNGVRVEVRHSAGSVQNVERLRSGEADVAFVQGGSSDQADGMLTLGSVYYEPVWVFYRGERRLERLTQLRGKRFAVGAEGSGVRQLALRLLEANAMAEGKGATLFPLSGLVAAEALERAEIDAMVVIAAPDAPVVQRLLRAPGVALLHFAEADAYLKLLPYLSKLVLPRAAIDLARMLPSDDTTLLAVTAHLVVREDLHPALQILLLQAATELHGGAGFFRTRGEFPSYKDPSLPLSPEAAHYYKSGAPLLQRYLPFWLAVLADRMIVLLVPVVALLLPLFKVLPALYRWRVRSRIFRLYGELKFLENDMAGANGQSRTAEYLERLDDIEARANELAIPIAFADLLYTLRAHVQLVRDRLHADSVGQPVSGGA